MHMKHNENVSHISAIFFFFILNWGDLKCAKHFDSLKNTFQMAFWIKSDYLQYVCEIVQINLDLQIVWFDRMEQNSRE